MKTWNKKMTDAVLGLAITALGILGYYVSFTIRDVPGTVSASAVPRLAAVLLAALGALLAILSFRAGKRESAKPKAPFVFPARKVASFAILIGLFVAYVYAMRILGFAVSTVAFMMALMVLLAPKGAVRPFQFLIVSVATTAVIYAVFVMGFNVMLPTGIFRTLGI